MTAFAIVVTVLFGLDALLGIFFGLIGEDAYIEASTRFIVGLINLTLMILSIVFFF